MSKPETTTRREFLLRSTKAAAAVAAAGFVARAFRDKAGPSGGAQFSFALPPEPPPDAAAGRCRP